MYVTIFVKQDYCLNTVRKRGSFRRVLIFVEGTLAEVLIRCVRKFSSNSAQRPN